jgi:hypothetical protein
MPRLGSGVPSYIEPASQVDFVSIKKRLMEEASRGIAHQVEAAVVSAVLARDKATRDFISFNEFCLAYQERVRIEEHQGGGVMVCLDGEPVLALGPAYCSEERTDQTGYITVSQDVWAINPTAPEDNV